MGKEVDTLSIKDQSDEFPPKQTGWGTYLKPKWATKILANNMGCFGTLIAIEYLMEMVAYIASANFYSDVDRLTPCTFTGTLAGSDAASAYFDEPILLLGIFHLISWLRVAVLSIVVCLGINLMHVWYITTPVTVLGIVAYAMASMVYFSEEGESCANAQMYRGQYILIEICASWAFVILNFMPFFIICMSKDKHDVNIRKSDDSDDEEEGEEEEDEK